MSAPFSSIGGCVGRVSDTGDACARPIGGYKTQTSPGFALTVTNPTPDGPNEILDLFQDENGSVVIDDRNDYVILNQ